MHERVFSLSEVVEQMRRGATLRRRLTTSEVTMTLCDGQAYRVPIDMIDSLVDQHKIEEHEGGGYKLRA
jgi:hypothetical protein